MIQLSAQLKVNVNLHQHSCIRLALQIYNYAWRKKKREHPHITVISLPTAFRPSTGGIQQVETQPTPESPMKRPYSREASERLLSFHRWAPEND